MQSESTAALHRVVERNIAALLESSREAEQNRSLEQRLADRITRFTGSMKFVYLHLVLLGFGSLSILAGFRVRDLIRRS